MLLLDQAIAAIDYYILHFKKNFCMNESFYGTRSISMLVRIFIHKYINVCMVAFIR